MAISLEVICMRKAVRHVTFRETMKRRKERMVEWEVEQHRLIAESKTADERR